jgi:hypothetical protein
MRRSDLQAAAEIFRLIVAKLEAGELRASTRTRARLEGAATALEAAGTHRRMRKR